MQLRHQNAGLILNSYEIPHISFSGLSYGVSMVSTMGYNCKISHVTQHFHTAWVRTGKHGQSSNFPKGIFQQLLTVDLWDIFCEYSLTSWLHGLVQCNINLNITQDKSNRCSSHLELIKYIPYLTISGELWGVYCEYSRENWPYERRPMLCSG